ncbi:extracellular solute-binding protein [Tessaracoccus sp. G1721]
MKRHNRRRFAAVAAASLLSLGLVACGGGTQPGTNPSANADAGASAWALTGGSEAAFRAAFEKWNTENPDRQIATEWFANDAYKEKIRTAVGSGNAPTLIYSWGGGTLADYAASGHVVDLTGSVDDLLERVIPSVAQNGQVDGKTYAVPNTQSQPVVLYYNAAVLEEAGVEVPTTYDELLAVSETLEAQGVIPFALAGQSRWPMLMWIQYLTDRIGGPEVFQAILDGEPDAWKDPAIIEATTRIQEMVDAGVFGDTFGSVVADASADVALVHTGKAAMLLQGSWVYPTFLSDAPDLVAAGDLGYTTFPAIDGGAGDPANIVGNASNFWSVSASATEEEQQIAKDFIASEVLSDDAVEELLAIGTVPPITGLEDQIAETDNAEYLSFVYGMVRDAPHFQLSWDQALPAAAAQELLNNLSQVFLGEITPEQFSENMNATLG